MIVYTYKKETVVLEDEAFSSGGEGEVRHVKSCPPRFKNICAKLYFKQQQTKERENKIRFMVENPPNNIVSNYFMMAWPLDTLYSDNGQFLGFLMPMAFADSKKLVILTTPKLKKIHKFEWYKFDKEHDIKMAIVTRLKLINNIAIPVYLLHATKKYILRDFKPDNVLVTPNGKVTIVDMDSIQICEGDKLLFPGTAATEEYIPPEFYKGVGRDKKPLNESWDSFAFSVVFYKLLFGLSPYVVTPVVETEDSCTIPYCVANNLFPFGENASKIANYPKPHDNFKIIPQPIQNLFKRAFGNNPDDRPSAMEWVKTIKQVVEKIGTVEEVAQPKKPVEEYSLSVVSSPYGEIELSKYKAKPGDLITVIVKPKMDYKFDNLSYSSVEGTIFLEHTKSFVMPNSNVKVCCSFLKEESTTKEEKNSAGVIIIKVLIWISIGISVIKILSRVFG